MFAPCGRWFYCRPRAITLNVTGLNGYMRQKTRRRRAEIAAATGDKYRGMSADYAHGRHQQQGQAWRQVISEPSPLARHAEEMLERPTPAEMAL